MKITIERIAIAVLVVIIIVFLLRDCARPSEELEAKKEKEYKTAIAILEVEKTSIQARQDSLIKTTQVRIERDSVARVSYRIENTRLKKQLTIRRPQVQVLIDSTPPLKAFIQTQDSIILTQDVRIDSLEASMDFQRKLNEDLIVTEFMEDKIEAQMALEQTRRIAELDKTAKKKGRGNRLWKGLSTVLAGAVLTETVLLIAD